MQRVAGLPRSNLFKETPSVLGRQNLKKESNAFATVKSSHSKSETVRFEVLRTLPYAKRAIQTYLNQSVYEEPLRSFPMVEGVDIRV